MPSSAVSLPRIIAIFAALVLMLFLGLCIFTSSRTFLAALGAPPHATDIDSFIAAGQMILEGRGAEIHGKAAILAQLQRFTEGDRAIIWNYPPHASLITALTLGPLSPAMARLAVSLGTFAAALGAVWLLLRHIEDKATAFVLAALLLASAPLLMALTQGQPAYLIGIATFLGAWQASRNHGSALLLLPVAVMKPHIAGPFFLAVFLLMPASRRMFIGGALVTIALTGVAELAIGPGATLRFIEAIRTASQAVSEANHYNTARLITPMAEMSVLFPQDKGMARLGALLASAFALAMVAPGLLRGRGVGDADRLAIAAIIPLWLTPYLYEYDIGLPLLALCYGLAVRTAHNYGLLALVALGALASLGGPLMQFFNQLLDEPVRHSIGLLSPVLLTAATALMVLRPQSSPRPVPA